MDAPPDDFDSKAIDWNYASIGEGVYSGAAVMGSKPGDTFPMNLYLAPQVDMEYGVMAFRTLDVRRKSLPQQVVNRAYVAGGGRLTKGKGKGGKGPGTGGSGGYDSGYGYDDGYGDHDSGDHGDSYYYDDHASVCTYELRGNGRCNHACANDANHQDCNDASSGMQQICDCLRHEYTLQEYSLLESSRDAYYAAHYYPSHDDDFEWPAPTYAYVAATPRGVFLLPALARDVVRISAGPQVTYDLSIRGTGKCEVERPNVYGFRASSIIHCVSACSSDETCLAVDLSVRDGEVAGCMLFLGREERLDYISVSGTLDEYPEPVTSWTHFPDGDFCLASTRVAMAQEREPHLALGRRRSSLSDAHPDDVFGAERRRNVYEAHRRRRRFLVLYEHRRRSALTNPNPDCTDASPCAFLAHRRRGAQAWTTPDLNCSDSDAKGPKWCRKMQYRCWMEDVRANCPLTCGVCLLWTNCRCQREVLDFGSDDDTGYGPSGSTSPRRLSAERAFAFARAPSARWLQSWDIFLECAPSPWNRVMATDCAIVLPALASTCGHNFQ